MTRRFIRYFAATDNSPIGMVALGYLSGLLRIAPVRVGSMTGGMSGRWEHYSLLLATPMDGDYVNVVCCAPERWTWEQWVEMPERTPTAGGTVSVAKGRQELYTAGKHNVLIAMGYPVASPQRDTARLYEHVVVPDDQSWGEWLLCRPMSEGLHRIPLPVTDHEALRSVVMP